jgi:hypothetical protein
MSPTILDPSSEDLQLLNLQTQSTNYHLFLHNHENEEDVQYLYEDYLRKRVRIMKFKHILTETIAVICGLVIILLTFYFMGD